MVLLTVAGNQEPEKKQEKTKEQLEKEIAKLKSRLKMTKCSLVQTHSQMELQSLRTRQLISAWRERVKDAEDASRRHQQQKDRELADISSQLFLLQGGLIKEQKRIQEVLRDKDGVIGKQSKKIHHLKKVNRKMATVIEQLKNQRGMKDNNDNVMKGKHGGKDTHFEQNVDESLTHGYNKKYEPKTDGYLDFPDVFDDRGQIKTPEGVLDLEKMRTRSKDEGISMSPSRTRKHFTLKETNACQVPNRVPSKQNTIPHVSSNDDVFPGTETNTFPKRRSILKHSQSQGTFTLRHNKLSDPYADNPLVPLSPRDRGKDTGIVNTRGSVLRHSQSQGAITLHGKTPQPSMFYLENSYGRTQSADFDAVSPSLDKKQLHYEHDMVGSYPDIVISAKAARFQRQRANTLHSIYPDNTTKEHVVRDKIQSQGQRRRMSSFTSGDEAVHECLFYTHSRRPSETNHSTSDTNQIQGRTLHRRMSSVTSTEGSDETFYIPNKSAKPSDRSHLKSKFSGARQKTIRRHRKRSTSEPGIEAKYAFMSHCEPGDGDSEVNIDEAIAKRGGRRGRIHSVEDAV